MKLIIDAHSWIEYFKGSNAGEKLNQMLGGDNEILVLPITISEVVAKVKKINGNVESAYSSIIKNSKIFEPTPKIAKEAGLLYVEAREKNESFGIVDALLIASAKLTGAKLISGDNHFKPFKEAIII
ncbi:MAG: PIN domain-containing protein [Nanoarchaeota archaeon]